MENTEIHYEMTVSTGLAEWNEGITGLRTFDGKIPAPSTDSEAIELAEKIIEFFNRDLRLWESPRRLTCVQRVEVKVIDIMEYKSKPKSEKKKLTPKQKVELMAGLKKMEGLLDKGIERLKHHVADNPLTECMAGRDTECNHPKCPVTDEDVRNGRYCTLPLYDWRQ